MEDYAMKKKAENISISSLRTQTGLHENILKSILSMTDRFDFDMDSLVVNTTQTMHFYDNKRGAKSVDVLEKDYSLVSKKGSCYFIYLDKKNNHVRLRERLYSQDTNKYWDKDHLLGDFEEDEMISFNIDLDYFMLGEYTISPIEHFYLRMYIDKDIWECVDKNESMDAIKQYLQYSIENTNFNKKEEDFFTKHSNSDMNLYNYAMHEMEDEDAGMGIFVVDKIIHGRYNLYMDIKDTLYGFSDAKLYESESGFNESVRKDVSTKSFIHNFKQLWKDVKAKKYTKKDSELNEILKVWVHERIQTIYDESYTSKQVRLGFKKHLLMDYNKVLRFDKQGKKDFKKKVIHYMNEISE